MPRAMGMGSHLILVFLRAEFSRERNDSFLWEFCCSKAARDDEKVREGAVRRTWRSVGGYGVWMRARASWREQVAAMAIALLGDQKAHVADAVKMRCAAQCLSPERRSGVAWEKMTYTVEGLARRRSGALQRRRQASRCHDTVLCSTHKSRDPEPA
jgi:hypothetical protein